MQVVTCGFCRKNQCVFYEISVTAVNDQNVTIRIDCDTVMTLKGVRHILL